METRVGMMISLPRQRLSWSLKRRDVEVKVSSAYRWIEVKASSASDGLSQQGYILPEDGSRSYLPSVLPEFTDLNHLRHIADENSLQAL
ncbi:hypothetical protein NC652_029196 [Populus alba x Populus x berolinensis]|nr:hypothetical protein NC652_029196 [Populus alba x Populus x berolinensis]